MRSFLRSVNIFVIIQLVTICVSAANYYVDKNASGQNNGTSWANAWKTFSAIKWNQIQPGDVIYISGGTDSTIYSEQLNLQTHGSLNNYVTVQNGVDAGHNGRVIIDGGFTRSYGVYIEQGCGSSQVGSWLYVKGLEIRRTKLHGVYMHCSVKNIVIDGCKVTEALGRSIMLIGNDDYYLEENGVCAKDIEIKNCYLESHPDESTTEDDVIFAQMVARLNIHNNYIHQQNRQSDNQPPNHMHIDCIQTHVVRNINIWNNVCVIDSGVYGHAMILGVQSRPGYIDSSIIYNNYIYGGGHLASGGNPNVPELYLRWYGYVNSVEPPTFVYNNTIVTANGGSYPIYHERPAWVKNNIIVQYGTNGQNPSNYGGVGRPTWQGGYNSSWYNDADYSGHNLMWRDYSNVSFAGNRWRGTGGSPVGTPSGWNDWVNRFGGTGINTNPQFVNNVRGRYGYVIGETSPARNAGENLKTFIESKGLPWTDIEGKPRGYSPDLGAYQFISGNGTFQLSVNIKKGFNLVSVPGINPEGMGVNNWWAYRDMDINVFGFSNGYQSVTTTTPGTGYWMKHSEDRIYNTGDEWTADGIKIVPHNPIGAVAGWNFIGGYELSVVAANVTTIPPGMKSGLIFKYSDGWQPTMTIDPGYGYLIKLTGAGNIIMPETLERSETAKSFLERLPGEQAGLGKILFTDAAGIDYTLYALKGDLADGSAYIDIDQYELPPVPPQEMFDIRFSSGRLVENLKNSVKNIEMSGVTYPLTIRVEGIDLNLIDETGSKVNVNLKSGEDVVISDAAIKKLNVTEDLIPMKYTLEQNYPNPFNPNTTIMFSLPKETKLKINVYNMLGQLVKTIAEGTYEAGYHKVTFSAIDESVSGGNAANLASGIYIYRIESDVFVQVKKMTLLR